VVWFFHMVLAFSFLRFGYAFFFPVYCLNFFLPYSTLFSVLLCLSLWFDGVVELVSDDFSFWFEGVAGLV